MLPVAVGRTETAAVAADWGPRDAYEHRWVMELVSAVWRQDRLRGLELATLTVAGEESPPSEATVRNPATFATYGARIDKYIGRAIQALRILRNRPDAWLDELRIGTSEPGEIEPQQQNCTNELPAIKRATLLRYAVTGRARLSPGAP